MQWRNELDAHTNGLKVLVWHGASRKSDTSEIEKYDVVLTTYAVLERCALLFACLHSQFIAHCLAVVSENRKKASNGRATSSRRNRPCTKFTGTALSWTRRTTSKNGPAIPPRRLSNCRHRTDGVSPERLCRIVLASFTVLSAFWEQTRSLITFVGVAAIRGFVQ